MYESLLLECESNNVEFKEKKLPGKIKGLYANNVIWLNNKLKNTVEKTCILAEELGHFYTSDGDILDQSSFENRKQELRARRWAYERLIPIEKLVQAKNEGINNRYELAEFLQVTEDFLQNTLDRYKEKYGLFIFVNGKKLYFDPLDVLT